MDDRPAVQVGDPFLEKCLIEACLEAFKTGAVVAAQDMGAAGITCSTAEMAAKGGVGIDFDLDKIPVRETGMIPYEYLLSESQERMLFVAVKGRENELIEIFHRWGLQAVVAGTVISEPIVRIWHQGSIAAEIPAVALAENTPLYEREILSQPPLYAQQAWQWSVTSLPDCTTKGTPELTWSEILPKLLSTPSIASKAWVYRQYDHQVQNNTVILPGGADAAIIRIRPLDAKPEDCTRGLAATTDCNGRYVYLDPLEGAKSAVAEAARNLSCVGAQPLAVTDNLNFGSPENPQGYWQLALACQGISTACRELGTPVTGGNVSLYNETLDAQGQPQAIYPTPVIGMIGLVENIQQVCGQGFKNPGDLVYLIGNLDNLSLAASEYLAQIHHLVAGKLPLVDFALERLVQQTCRYGISQGWFNSAHDCSEGGLLVTLAESCLGNNLGATITLPPLPTQLRWDEYLFGEAASRIVASVKAQNQANWESYLQENLPQHWCLLGKVSTTENLAVLSSDSDTLVQVTIDDLSQCWHHALEKAITDKL